MQLEILQLMLHVLLDRVYELTHWLQVLLLLHWRQLEGQTTQIPSVLTVRLLFPQVPQTKLEMQARQLISLQRMHVPFR